MPHRALYPISDFIIVLVHVYQICANSLRRSSCISQAPMLWQQIKYFVHLEANDITLEEKLRTFIRDFYSDRC